MVYQLDKRLWFPDPRLGEADGLVAIGGDLSVGRLLLAYSNGFFPWYAYQMGSEPHWYCPLDRFVIFPGEIHISHSMRQLLKQHKYEVTMNQDFDGVSDIIEAYTEMHRRGFATSVEVWEGERLVGGLYGIALGKAFFGESMFSLVPNASKLALIHLGQYMQQAGGTLIDCQFETSHLLSMGGRHITYEQYMELI